MTWLFEKWDCSPLLWVHQRDVSSSSPNCWDGKTNHPSIWYFPLGSCKACCDCWICCWLLPVIWKTLYFILKIFTNKNWTCWGRKDLKNNLKCQPRNSLKVIKPGVHCEDREVIKALLIYFVDCYHHDWQHGLSYICSEFLYNTSV